MRIALAVLLFALVASAAASDYYRIDWDIMAEGTGSHVAGVVHRNDELEGNSNTYVVGSFAEQLAFTGDSILETATQATSPGTSFVAEVGVSGRGFWAGATGARGNSASHTNVPFGMTPYYDGGLLVVGEYRGELNFNNPDLTAKTSTDSTDAFLVHLDKSFSNLDMFNVGGPGDQSFRDVAQDSENNVYVAGWYTESLIYGRDSERAADGAKDAFVMAYKKMYSMGKNDACGLDPGILNSNALMFSWVISLGAEDSTVALERIELLNDNTNDLIAVGTFSGNGFSVNDTSGKITHFAASNSAGIFLMRVTNDGRVLWIRGSSTLAANNGKTAGEFAHEPHVATGYSTSDVFLTAVINGVVSFPDDEGSPVVVGTAGQLSTIVVKYSGAGTLQWVRFVGSTNGVGGDGSVVDPATDSLGCTVTVISDDYVLLTGHMVAPGSVSVAGSNFAAAEVDGLEGPGVFLIEFDTRDGTPTISNSFSGDNIHVFGVTTVAPGRVVASGIVTGEATFGASKKEFAPPNSVFAVSVTRVYDSGVFHPPSGNPNDNSLLNGGATGGISAGVVVVILAAVVGAVVIGFVVFRRRLRTNRLKGYAVAVDELVLAGGDTDSDEYENAMEDSV